MAHIQEIFKTYAPAYIRQYGDRMPKNHIKAVNAITSCRTAAAGIVIYDCVECGRPHMRFLSCGNRHCSLCQSHKTRQWLEKQIDRQMPGHHFMITFTVPEQLREVIRGHQRTAYEAMFAASSQTLKIFAADPRYVGGNLPGFFGVLHTWGRQLQYHPHIHYVVTGGAVSVSDGRWHPSSQAFFAPVNAMSLIFRAKLKELFRNQGLYSNIDPDVWQKGFNVNCQAMTGSHQSIRYLAPYVFKVAITDRRIIAVENDVVRFRYKKSGSQRWRTMTLATDEFIRRFLQHVLPTGFMKIRYFGFMGSKPSVRRDQVRALIEMAYGFDVDVPAPEPASERLPVCEECGARLIIRYVVAHPFGPGPDDG